ncbi:MAG: large conductance mechanosensitive channel protein MscL [Lachnospiraceae bacterium]|nr:large conductance mechanosensitive channel protein MscL [Lachnospiraceae bacterium]
MAGFVSEFKEFISRGNVMDMAVGVVVGGAFGSIVTSLVDDIIGPIIGAITGGIDFSKLAITIGSANIMVGSFIQAIINFLIIALCIFSVIKAFNKAKDLKNGPQEEAAPTTKICPFCQSEISIAATRCPHCTSELK